ncbi:hypothetical protein EHS13_33515 [Paenibacillus psychroresistens]|uniref:Uncharacterized protein n=1 Tax=Paenibacillus psychroresistens TaxID=1778678 RepID=A0A6B8RUD9_9BACL|nr:hypothetical protein [Paenibacillus psychroresistens]QGQ99432.1 hypothetical protein EHS13_33515 [Paenibacillus psychroresistens]
MKRSYKKSIIIIVGLAIIYVLFFPSPTPEMAVRMSLLIRQPLLAFSSSVEKGRNVGDPQSGDLYIVKSYKRPFFIVKKYKLGWVANAGGTGP